MKKIEGYGRTIRELLSGAKYAIDYYQREYKWEKKHVAELIEDLTEKFFEDYEEGAERIQVQEYGHYFLGSIIISDKDGQKFIIDGQQRLTTLTLLLIYLNNLQRNREEKVHISELIFSEKYAKKSFNLDVPERTFCMETLFNDGPFDDNGQPESVRNIAARYTDIEALFPEELKENALPYFIDWLIDNVHLVEITAYSDKDAYTIFETMNDRGLSLSPADMLKGYLLANITDANRRLSASKLWKDRIGELVSYGKDEHSDCIKAWLRSQYANSIRERKRGAKPQDFDLIGTEFHRWVRDNRDALELNGSGDFALFIERNLAFYARQYLLLRKSADELKEGMESIFYNAQHDFTLQYPVLLAPLRSNDTEEEIFRKLRIVGNYLDILIARRIWNFRSISYSTMQYAMFLVMRDIRGKSVEELVQILQRRLADDAETFETNNRFYLHGQNKPQLRQILARMTTYVETQSGMPSRFAEYIAPSGKKGYEVEHIWADHPERHKDEFDHPNDFKEYRNRIGGLLLLPKSFNASYSDLPYEEKREHYLKQNLLAQSLHDLAYERNPGFGRFVKESGLPFMAHSKFKKADLDARQSLYLKLAEQIWSPKRLEEEVQK